jgi:hypothetical protein
VITSCRAPTTKETGRSERAAAKQKGVKFVMIDWDADADLHVLAQMQTEPRKSPKYLKTGKLVTLVKELMEKRPADRQAYSITVGDEEYDAAAIEDLYNEKAGGRD